MKTIPHPITIIGGNIAGLSAAYHLARKGCPVTVYERKIWDKPCGGAITIEYAQYLKNTIGIDLHGADQCIPHIRFYFSGHQQHYVETEGLFVTISRQKLQQQLISRLEEEPNINIIFKHMTLKDFSTLSEQTILASGFSGFTRHIIGKEWDNREYALALRYAGYNKKTIHHPAHLMAFNSLLKGYGWFFCGRNHYFNIGIGGLIKKEVIYDKYKEFIKSINDRFSYEICPESLPDEWKIPITLNSWSTPISFHKNGTEFIGTGDAIGLAHPVIAAGIEPAWQSGWLLGESYDRASHSINISRYRHLLKKNLQLTSRKPFDIIISSVLRLKWIPYKDQMAYLLMKLFHKKIIHQIKKYPWFAMVHDGKKETGFKIDT